MGDKSGGTWKTFFYVEPALCNHSSQVRGLMCPWSGAQVATTSPLLVYLASKSALVKGANFSNHCSSPV